MIPDTVRENVESNNSIIQTKKSASSIWNMIFKKYFLYILMRGRNKLLYHQSSCYATEEMWMLLTV